MTDKSIEEKKREIWREFDGVLSGNIDNDIQFICNQSIVDSLISAREKNLEWMKSYSELSAHCTKAEEMLKLVEAEREKLVIELDKAREQAKEWERKYLWIRDKREKGIL